MKIRKLLITCAALLLLLLISAPLVLKNQGIQQQAANNLSKLIGEHGSFGAIQWRWLPFPSLIINDFNHTSKSLKLSVPKLIYYPNWFALFNKDTGLGKITLVSPAIDLKLQTEQSSNISFPAAKDLKLPKINIEIEHGVLTLAAGELASKVEHQSLVFQINADLRLENNRLKFKADGTSNFTKSFTTLARIDFTKQYYRFDLQAKGLNLLNIINSQQQVCKPQASKFNLKINLEGLGLKNWRMNIFAPDADISSIIAQQPVQIDGIDTISITRHDADFFLTIKNLNFARLAKTINGNISSTINKDSIREWDVDLSAENINIKETRTVTTAIFGKNKYVAEVFDVIRGGEASDARFILKGNSEAFKHFKNYKIWATAHNLPIFIRGIGLKLDETNGPISIIDGVLTGSNLTAEIGTKNHGVNGKLLLGLTPTNHAFLLDLDLDVDLIDLQDVLSEIITNDNFQNELANFDIVTGRAQGNLLLADNLYNLQTTVKINKFYGTASFDRIPWRFDFKGSELNVLPHEVNWQNIDVDYGPHKISQSKGLVNWQNEVVIEFNSPEVALDLGPLFDNFHIITNDEIIILHDYASVITDIAGSANLTDVSFAGKIAQPEQWQYAAKIDTDFTLSSPNMPPDTLVTGAHANVTNNKVTYSGNFQFFDQQIVMSGDYWHHSLQNWQGYTELNGLIGNSFGKWLRGKSAIDKMFFPKLPFAVKKYKLTTSPEDKHLQMSGTIIAQPKGSSPVTLKVDINQLKDDAKYNISVKDGGNTAIVSATISKRPKHRSVFSWQGTLFAESLDKIFENNFLNSGELSGVFSYLKSDEGNIKHKFAGYLEAHDVQLSADNKLNDLIINNLQINGEDNFVKIRSLDLGVQNEALNISGKVTAQKSKYYLNLQLTAEDIYWTPIRNFLDKALYTADKEQPNDAYDILVDRVSGDIEFNIANFYYPKKLPLVSEEDLPLPSDNSTNADNEQQIINLTENNGVASQASVPKADKSPPITITANKNERQLVFSTIQGTASFLDNDTGTKIEIESSNLCGLSLTGTWYNKQANRPSIYTIIKDDPNSPLLQKTLPCLYTDNSVIEGPYTLKSQLIGEPGNWSDGFVVFESNQGIIRRMNLLSNIFSVINFTDLFTSFEAENGDNTGLIYNDMVFKGRVEDNTLKIDQAVLKGKGVNITSQGKIDLETYNADLTFFVAPFKMIDSVVTSIPLIGKAIGGKKQSILTIPVAVEGPLIDPNITAMDPASVGSATLKFIMETLTLPFRIFMSEKNIEYELKHDGVDIQPTIDKQKK